MTRDEIAVSVRENLNDGGITFYTEDDINNSIQDGYDEVVSIAQPYEKLQTSIGWESKKTYYKIVNTVPDFLAIMAIFNNNTNKWLTPNTLDNLKIHNDLWETIQGESYEFVPIDFRTFAVFPRLESAVGSFDLFYKATAPTLIGSSVPQIPDSLQIILEHYATGDLFEQAEEWTKAQKYWVDYFDLLDKTIIEISKRSMPDRLMMLREQLIEHQLGQ